MSISSIRQTWYSRLISLFLVVTFVTSFALTPRASYASGFMDLPQPGTMVSLSPAYVPLMITGLTIHPENPLLMDFIVSTGNDVEAVTNRPYLKQEANRLIKYFLASLTIPENNQWVNLSPYEKDRIIPDDLGQTVLGQDMLAQDYILKQLTASLIYPEKNLGRNFWDRVYAKASQMYGTTQIPVNTFNKVWILPDTAKVFEHKNTVFVVKSHLKVMLDEDYLALQKHNAALPSTQLNDTHSIGANIVRQIILPAIEQEVNQGQNFAQMRQIYNSMILAVWFKNNLKQALLNQVYTDRSKINGVNVDDPTIKEKIYKQYVEAYKKGVFNYIKEEVDQSNQERIPRKYFSGGLVAPTHYAMATSSEVAAFSGEPGSALEVQVATNPTATVENYQPASFDIPPEGVSVELNVSDAFEADKLFFSYNAKNDTVSFKRQTSGKTHTIATQEKGYKLGEKSKEIICSMRRVGNKIIFKNYSGVDISLESSVTLEILPTELPVATSTGASSVDEAARALEALGNISSVEESPASGEEAHSAMTATEKNVKDEMSGEALQGLMRLGGITYKGTFAKGEEIVALLQWEENTQPGVSIKVTDALSKIEDKLGMTFPANDVSIDIGEGNHAVVRFSKAAFGTNPEALKELSGLFGRALESQGKKGGLSYLPSRIKLGSIQPGKYIAINWGGTNLNIKVFEFIPGQKPKVISKVSRKFNESFIKEGARQEKVFDFVVDALKSKELDLNPQEDYSVGFVFSFTMDHTSPRDAIVTDLSKGWERVEGIMHKNPRVLLEEALARGELTKIKVDALMNDTVATLLAGGEESEIGIIHGSGTNFAVKNPKTGEIINLESGNFNAIPIALTTPYDTQILSQSDPAGKQRLEKMISGKYLIQLFHQYVEHMGQAKAVRFSHFRSLAGIPWKDKAGDDIDSKFISELASVRSNEEVSDIVFKFLGERFDFSSLEAARLRAVSQNLLVRSGEMLGATIGSILTSNKTATESSSVHHLLSIDGSVYSGNEIVRDSFLGDLGREGWKRDQVTVVLPEDASALGAAIGAAMNRPMLAAAAMTVKQGLRRATENRWVSRAGTMARTPRARSFGSVNSSGTERVGLHRRFNNLTRLAPGGIDLNSKNLHMESEGQKVNITFNQAMIAQFRRGDFSGVRIQILDVVPISLMPLLGLKEDEESGRVVKA